MFVLAVLGAGWWGETDGNGGALLVVDSVAALFRSEFQADQGLERSRHLTAFATALHKLSASYQLPILCVNQVGGLGWVMGSLAQSG